MPPISDAQASAIVKRGSEILEEASRLTSGVDPNYIRDAQPDSIFEALPLAAARQGCRRYADKGGDYPELRAARAERACRPYLDSLEYGQPPSLELPFRGGQCCGVGYTYTYTFRNPNTGELQDSEQSAFNVQILGLFERSNQPSQATITGGIRVRRCDNGAIEFRPLGTTFEGMSLEQSISNIARQDGLPDDCGNPVPEYTPPQPPPQPGPTREPFTIAPNVDIDIAVEVNVDGSINVDVGTGPITIDPFDEPEDPNGGGGDGVPPGFQGEPGAPVDVGPGDAADETDPNRNLIGVLVQTIQLPPRANQVFNETETYTKGAYFVYFGGEGGLSLNPEGAITIQDQFFYAPEGTNRFRVVPNVGFTIRVIPFYED